MIAAHGGDARVATDPERLPRAPETVTLTSTAEGWVTGIDPLALGLTAVAMGAGRTRADQAVDHAVGIELLATRGARVAANQPLARLHVRSRAQADEALPRVRAAFTIAPEPCATTPLILDRIIA
jgi:thymidine phosphorylase